MPELYQNLNNGATDFAQISGSVLTVSDFAFGVMATADFDGDGRVDVVPSCRSPAACTMSPLYHNAGGNYFKKAMEGVSASTGVSWTLSVAIGDYDNECARTASLERNIRR